MNTSVWQAKKEQAKIRRHARQMQERATQELVAFETTIQAELDTQIQALMAEKDEKLQSIVEFQKDLRAKIQQLEQMVVECDDKANALSSGYEACVAALREDFAATLAAQQTAVNKQVCYFDA